MVKLTLLHSFPYASDSAGQKESYSVVWSDWSKSPMRKLDNLYNRDKKSIGNIRAPLGYLIGLLYHGIQVNEKLQNLI